MPIRKRLSTPKPRTAYVERRPGVPDSHAMPWMVKIQNRVTSYGTLERCTYLAKLWNDGLKEQFEQEYTKPLD